MTLGDVYKVGHRKAVMAFVAFLAVTGYAFYARADFEHYASAVTWLLGLALGAHVTQQATAKAPAEPPTP